MQEKALLMVLKNMKEKKFVREKNEDKWEKGKSLISIQILTYMLAFLHFLLLSKFQVYPSLRFF